MPEHTLHLLRGALEGSDTARSQLFDRVRARLTLWVTTRLSPALRAKVEPDDVVQETLIAVHKGLDGFSGEGDKAFLAWLFTIAENRIRDLADHFGAKKRQQTEDVVLREFTSPSGAAVRNEMAIRVRDALTRLTEPHQQVIQLRRFEELGVPEIARRMERSENAVRVLYCRALAALKEELGAV